jgi:hypothetical protein
MMKRLEDHGRPDEVLLLLLAAVWERKERGFMEGHGG